MASATVAAAEKVDNEVIPEKLTSISVRALKENGFAFARSEFSDFPAVADLIGYIDFLAMNNETSADSMELPIEKQRTKYHLKTDRSGVNELFFKYVDSLKEAEAKNIVLPNDEDMKVIETMAKGFLEQKAIAMNNTVNSHLANAVSHHNNEIAELVKAKTVRDNIEAMKENGGKFAADSVKKAVQETPFNFKALNMTEKWVEFISRTDTMLRFKDEKAGIDHNLNFGKFIIKIMFSGTLTIKRSDPFNQIIIGSSIHPHAKENNHPCWGNAADSAGKALVAGDYPKILKIIASLLQNYNPDSPYTAINEFAKAMKARDEINAKEHNKKKEQKEKGQAQTQDDEILEDDDDFIDDFIDEDGE